MECWKDIKGYEGLYQISNLGQVKSIMFRNKMTFFQRDKTLKLYTNKLNGYEYVSLSKKLQIASLNGHLCHIRRTARDIISGQERTH